MATEETHAFIPRNKGQQLDSYQLLDYFGFHLRSFSKTVQQKHGNKHTEEEDRLMLPAIIPYPQGMAQCRKETS